MKATFKNGDTWTGETIKEGQETFYLAEDSDGNLYETHEIPAYRINMNGAVCTMERPTKNN